jgi:hypothetical protein
MSTTSRNEGRMFPYACLHTGTSVVLRPYATALWAYATPLLLLGVA